MTLEEIREATELADKLNSLLHKLHLKGNKIDLSELELDHKLSSYINSDCDLVLEEIAEQLYKLQIQKEQQQIQNWSEK